MNFKNILQMDADLSARLRLSSNTGFVWKTAAFLAHSGDSWFWMAGLGIIWLFSDADWKYRTVTLAVAIVIQATFVLGVKFLIRRQRPEGDWGAIYRNTDPHSFPSGHATRAALLATMAWILGPIWLAWTLTIWAPFVSLARVATGVHYLSDVVVGMFTGVVIAILLMSFHMPDLLMRFFPFVF